MARSTRRRYRAIAEELRDRIAAGRYPVGSALPRNTDLVREFHASAGTIHRATSMLVGEGLVLNRGRLGLEVRRAAVRERLSVVRIASFPDDWPHDPLGPRLHDQSDGEETVAAPRNIADRFSLAVGDPVTVRRVKLIGESDTVELRLDWRPEERRARDQDLGVLQVSEELWSITSATVEQARTLGCAPGVPIWRRELLLVDGDSVASVRESFFPGDQFALSLRMTREAAPPTEADPYVEDV